MPEEEEVAQEGAADAGEEEASAGASVANMKPGFYMLHVLVETAKNMGLEGEDTVDPLIKVKILMNEKSTSNKKGITRTTPIKWDEHLFIEVGEKTQKEIEGALIEIEILNKGFFKSDMIGYFPLSTLTIYNMPGHLVHNQQFAFTNPEAEDKSKISGYVTMSINLQGPGDDAAQLKMGTDKTAAKRKPWMPASVQKEYKQLYFKFIKAQHLPIMDTGPFGGTIDAYIFIDHMGSQLKTKVITMKDNLVEWDQEFLMPLELPASNDLITFQLYDKDLVGTDDLVASLQFSIKDMLKTDSSNNAFLPGHDGKKKDKDKKEDKKDAKEGECEHDTDREITYTTRWVNLYGSNPDYSNKQAEKQNKEISEATTFKGRILVEYWTIDHKHPVMKVRDCKEDEAYLERQNRMALKEYLIQCEIGSAICLPDTKNYSIKVTMGELFWDTGKPKQGKDQKMCNYARWSFRVKEDFKSCHQHLHTMPDVFIYLMDGDVPVCFFRDKLTNYTDENAPTRWRPFECDLAVGKVKDAHLAGLFQFRLYLHETTKNGQWDPNSVQSWKRQPSKRMNAFKIRAYIYQAESLPACDATGASDPYIECWTPDDQNIKTIVVEQTNNPLYYETKEFLSEFNDIQEAPPVILNFFDTDIGWFASKDEYMGRACIFLRDVDDLSTDDRIPVPKWYPVKYSFGDPHDEKTGAVVLVSFACVEYDYDFLLSHEAITLEQQLYMPGSNPRQPLEMPNLDIEEYNIEITVLGFRNLVSAGLLPVKKAYAKFSIKSILAPAQAKAVSDIFTSPDEGGEDPNVRTTLQLSANIPSIPFYCPRMTCTCYDKLYFEGMAQPIIGIFTLKIGDILTETRQRDAKIIEDLKEMNETLQEALDIKKEIKGHPENDRTILKILNRLKGEDESKSVANMSAVDPNQLKLEEDNADLSMASVNSRQKAKQDYEANLIAEKAKIAAEREEAMAALADNQDGNSNVIYPKYKYDERLLVDKEVEFPPSNLFMSLGFNCNAQSSTKHYRRFYPDELENCREVMPASPFLHEDITRIEKKSAGLFGSADADPSSSNVRVTGKFKGLVKVFNKERLEKRMLIIDSGFKLLHKLTEDLHEIQLDRPLFFDKENKVRDFEWKSIDDAKERVTNIPILQGKLTECGLGTMKIDEFISNYKFQSEMGKRLQEIVPSMARIYIIEGFNFAQKDLFSPSDPYLIIQCGATVFNERKDYQLDTSEPVFYKSYDFNISFPGAPQLIITSNDYDDFFGDDLIGTTKLDFDDRFFNKEWQAIEHKPIEYRDLYHPTSTISQGTVKMWCEVNPSTSKKSSLEAIDITPEPKSEYEIRLVIWKTKDIEAMDWEGTSDIFVRAFLDPDDDHITDTHWRCTTGKGSFNWRLKIPAKSHEEEYILSIQAWDKDVIASNDLIGDFQLDISPIFEDTHLTNKLQAFNKDYWNDYMKDVLKEKDYEHCDDIQWEDKECFWIPMRRMCKMKDGKVNEEEGEDEMKYSGSVLCSLRIYPIEAAKKANQGVGRQEPNNDPLLPEPEGRFKLSLNPFAMLNQLLGAKQRMMLYGGCCCIICAGLCSMMAPMIISSVVASWFTGGSSAPAPVAAPAPAPKPAAVTPAPAPAASTTPATTGGRLLQTDSLNIQSLVELDEQSAKQQSDEAEFQKLSNSETLVQVIDVCEQCVNHRQIEQIKKFEFLTKGKE